MGRGFREKPSPISWLGVWHDEAQAERKEPVQGSHRSDKNLSFVPARAQSVGSFHEVSPPPPNPRHVLRESEEATQRHCTRGESQTEGWHRQPAVMEASWEGGGCGHRGTALT